MVKTDLKFGTRGGNELQKIKYLNIEWIKYYLCMNNACLQGLNGEYRLFLLMFWYHG